MGVPMTMPVNVNVIYPIPTPPGVELPQGYWVGSDLVVYDEMHQPAGSLKPAPAPRPVPEGVELPEGCWLGEDLVVYDDKGCRIGELRRDSDDDDDEGIVRRIDQPDEGLPESESLAPEEDVVGSTAPARI